MTRPLPDGGVAPPKPDPVTRANVWVLGANPGGLREVATLWSALAESLSTESSTFAGKVSSTMGKWNAVNGKDFAASYAGAQRGGLTDAAGHCTSVARALTTLAAELEGVQRQLSASLGRLSAAMPHAGIGLFGIDPFLRFSPQDARDVALIDSETTKAIALQNSAKGHVATCSAALRGLPAGFGALVAAWKGEADDSSHRWANRPSRATTFRTVQTVGGTTIVSGTSADEHIRIQIDAATGDTVVIFSEMYEEEVDGRSYLRTREVQRIPVPVGQEVVISSGSGDDRIEVPAGTNVKLRILLGDGDDQLNAREASNRIEAFGGTDRDRITTGRGADFVSGGGGDDYLDTGASADQVFGGEGSDIIYGLDGNDLLSGGGGRDALDGGSHDDAVFGGADSDVVGGGRDDDALFGGSGNDDVYGGHGTDVADGGVTASGERILGDDDELNLGAVDTSRDDSDRVVIVEYDGTAGGFIEIEGSPEFHARVQSDIEFLRSTPTGQQMLRTLGELHDEDDGSWWFGQDKRPYIISEYPRDLVADNGDAWDADGNYTDPPREDAYVIRYRPEFHTLDGADPLEDYRITPPVVVLYHEMGHTYQFLSDTAAEGRTLQDDGTSVNSIERQNVGLPWNENDLSGDDIGEAPDEHDPADQHVYRENGFREDLGLPDRTNY